MVGDPVLPVDDHATAFLQERENRATATAKTERLPRITDVLENGPNPQAALQATNTRKEDGQCSDHAVDVFGFPNDVVKTIECCS